MSATTSMTQLTKSNGHLEFIGDFEFFLFNGELYRARISNVMNVDGYRSGRWEAPAYLVEEYLNMYRGFED